MADNRYKQVQAFNAPTAYDQQMVEARRRRRMAEALAQQAYVPQDVGVAPIPAAAPLVQGLQAFLSARAARKADEAEEKAGAAATRTGAELARLLTGGRLPETEAALTEVTPAGRIGPAKVEDLIEVAPAGRIGTAPTQDDIMRLAMTSGGVAAMKGNPLLAARLAQTMEKPSQMEVGAVNLGDLTPDSARRFARSRNPEDIEYRAPPVKAPATVGGMMFDETSGKFVPIEGYEDQARRIAEAKRPDVVVRDTSPKGPSESALWRAEDKLRGDFEQITAPLRAQLTETQKITDIFNKSGNNPKAISAISQQSLIILLNKFLDPTSVVREGEFNRVVEAQGLEARARNYVARIMEGKPLDVSAINQIADLAKLYERAADTKIRQYANEYATVAETRGLDVGSIITNPNYRPRKKIADEDVEVQ